MPSAAASAASVDHQTVASPVHWPSSSRTHTLLTWHCLLQVYRGMFDAARGIMREQGPSGLYRGLGVTLVEIMPYAALQFGLYDLFNSLYKQAQVGPSGEAA